MSATVLSVLLTFALITVAGGAFAHNLQHRTWIRQQRFSSQEKRIAELKAIFAELDLTLSRRLYRTRRLLYALRRYSEARLASALEQYDIALGEWNEKRNSYQVRLVRVVNVSLAQDFEHDLSRRFIRIGAHLEKVARSAIATKAAPTEAQLLTDLEIALDELSRSVYVFLRTIYITLQTEQDDLYKVDRFQRIPESEQELAFVSTWFLFKSLFIPPPQLSEES